MLELFTLILQALLSGTLLRKSDNLTSPSSCLRTSTTLDALITCLDAFTVPYGHYTEYTYNIAQPMGTQREDWKGVVMNLLSTNKNCTLQVVPTSLQDVYTIEPFQDYCIFYEKSSRYGIYLKGWGYMIVPGTREGVSRNIHISAPHPQYDLGTVPQAASVFKSTGANSFLVPGRARQAFMSPSGCIQPRSSSQHYYKTDPAHNNEEPFFDASIAINDWLNEHGGCPSSSCAILQFHGKGTSTCPSDHVFLSSGLASKSWYMDDIDRPIKRLYHNLRLTFPSWIISLPPDSHCPLTATKNVVGRHLNGVDLPHVCSMATTSQLATGIFLHIEQGEISRRPTSYSSWSQVLLDTFDAFCSEGMVLDPTTKLCVYL